MYIYAIPPSLPLSSPSSPFFPPRSQNLLFRREHRACRTGRSFFARSNKHYLIKDEKAGNTSICVAFEVGKMGHARGPRVPQTPRPGGHTPRTGRGRRRRFTECSILCTLQRLLRCSEVRLELGSRVSPYGYDKGSFYHMASRQ